MRKFEKVTYEQFKNDCIAIGVNIDDKILTEVYNKIKMPIRKTKYSAGYDIHTPFAFTICKNENVTIPTGIKVKMEEDEYLALHIRSSLGFKYNINLANITGIIDFDYYDNKSNEGHIMIKLVNHGMDNMSFQKDDAIVQGIFSKYYTTDDDDASEKRNGGIGSTGA